MNYINIVRSITIGTRNFPSSTEHIELDMLTFMNEYKNLCKFPSLKSLSIIGSDCCDENKTWSFYQSGFFLPALEELSLKNLRVTAELDFIENFENLRSLSLNQVTFSDCKFRTELLKNLPNLKKLDLTDTVFSDSDSENKIEIIAELAETLDELKLDGTYIGRHFLGRAGIKLMLSNYERQLLRNCTLAVEDDLSFFLENGKIRGDKPLPDVSDRFLGDDAISDFCDCDRQRILRYSHIYENYCITACGKCCDPYFTSEELAADRKALDTDPYTENNNYLVTGKQSEYSHSDDFLMETPPHHESDSISLFSTDGETVNPIYDNPYSD